MGFTHCLIVGIVVKKLYEEVAHMQGKLLKIDDEFDGLSSLVTLPETRGIELYHRIEDFK